MSRLQVAGLVLVVTGAIGFLTIADDLRHLGEVLGVGSILAVGLLLLVAGSSESSRNRPAAL